MKRRETGVVPSAKKKASRWLLWSRHNSMFGWQMWAVLLVMSSGAAAVAMVPSLASPPTDEAEIGNAYVEAWQALRLDFDTLDHGDAHPAVIHEWLAEAPESLLLDFMAYGQNPTLVLLAARVYSTHKNAQPQRLIALQQAWRNSPLVAPFASLRVLAKDADYTKILQKRLAAKGDAIRISAAEILALAGDRQGISVLVKEVTQCGPQVRRAAHGLARMGKEDERGWLERGIESGCEPIVLEAASGEILFRQLFPFHYELLQRRDAGESRYRIDAGMYQAWFRFVRHARAQGIQTGEMFFSYLNKFKDLQVLWPQQDPALSKRNLDALIDFFSNASAALRTCSPHATWPKSYADAVQALRDNSATGFERRVSAAISILKNTGAKVNMHEGVNEHPVHMLSPRGGRAMDGNWRTSWQGKQGDVLILEWSTPVTLDAIQVATGCVQSPGGWIRKVSARVLTEDGEVQISATLRKDVRFFQEVAVSKTNVNRVELELTRLWDAGPACVPEIRVVTK